ncbi:MAG: alginate lyase family protein [Ignavibacteriaceae bacterium]
MLYTYSPNLSIKHLNFLKLNVPSDFQDSDIEDADSILNMNFECFGSYNLNIFDNWSFDFVNKYKWEKKFYQKYKLKTWFNHADVKVPWEINRLYFLLPLAKAYNINKNKKYIFFIEHLIQNWIKSNPFPKSINWFNAMEVSIRAVNLIFCVSLCKDYFSKSLSMKRISQSLYLHGLFIYNNLEKHEDNISSNHYYSNIVGLIYLGLFLKGNKFANKWLDFAIKEFYKETLIQFYPSGVNYELSTSYHRLMTEMLLSVIIQLKKNNYEIPIEILERAEKVIEYIYYYTRPDGSAPIIGDADDGRLHILGNYIGWDRNDHRYLLAIGHLLFNRKEWQQEKKYYEDAYLLLNERFDFETLTKTEMPQQSKAFKDAGVYIFRNKDDYVFIKTSNLGAFETKGWHTHNDVLSFELVLNGVPLIIDPGVGQYSRDINERNLFRSTFNHNTVSIDGFEQNYFDNSLKYVWSNKRNVVSKIDSYHFSEKKNILKAHLTWNITQERITHIREFIFDNEKEILSIYDSFVSSNEYIGQWNFVFHPEIKLEKITNTEIKILGCDQEFVISSNLKFNILNSLYSPSYLKNVKTLKIVSDAVFNSETKYFIKISKY